MEDRIRRSLSPLPSLLIGGALIAMFAAERIAGDGAGRVVLDVAAGLLFVTGALIRLGRLAGLRDAARSFNLAALACYGVLGVGVAAYALSLALGEPGQPAGRGAIVLMSASVLLLALGLGPLLALELTALRMRPAGFVERYRTREALGVGLSLMLAIAALFAVNYAVNQRPWRYDASFGAPTKPSEATVSMLQAAPSQVELYLFLGRGSEVYAEVVDYFDSLAEAGAKVSVQDQAADPDLAKELKVSGNGYVALKSGERTGKWYLGTEVEAARSRLKQLDSHMREELARVTIESSTVFFTAGHGERSKEEASEGDLPAGHLLRELLKGYNAYARPLGTAEGLGAKVPDNAALVVVFGPTATFLPEEVESLRAYARQGGSLMLLLDPGVDAGLAPLLQDLGLSLEPGVVCNDRVYVQRSRTEADHAFLATNSFTNHPTVKTLNAAGGRGALLLLEAGALSKASGQGPKVTFVARSLPQGFKDLNGNYVFDRDAPRETFNLVAAVELDAAPPADGQAEAEPRAGRALVAADADLLADLLLGNQGNQLLAYESLGWLLREDKLAGEVAVEEDVPIRHTRDSDKIWFYSTTFVTPALVLGAGLGFISIKRRRRRS